MFSKLAAYSAVMYIVLSLELIINFGIQFSLHLLKSLDFIRALNVFLSPTKALSTCLYIKQNVIKTLTRLLAPA